MKKQLLLLAVCCLLGGSVQGIDWRNSQFNERSGYLKARFAGEANLKKHLEVGVAALSDPRLSVRDSLQFGRIAEAVRLKAAKPKHRHRSALQALHRFMGVVRAELASGAISHAVVAQLACWQAVPRGSESIETRILAAALTGANATRSAAPLVPVSPVAQSHLHPHDPQVNDLQGRLAQAQRVTEQATDALTAEQLARMQAERRARELAQSVLDLQGASSGGQPAAAPNNPALNALPGVLAALEGQLADKSVKKKSWHLWRWFFGAVALALLVDGIVRKKSSSPLKLGKVIAKGAKLFWAWVAGSQKRAQAVPELSPDEQQELLGYMLMSYDPELTEQGELSNEELVAAADLLTPEERDDLTRKLLAAHDPEMMAALENNKK